MKSAIAAILRLFAIAEVINDTEGGADILTTSLAQF